MSTTRQINRRQAIIAGATGIVATTLARANAAPKARNPICIFTKPFNSLSFDELADRIAELGVDGIEAPVREGGHVDPAEVEGKLPELAAALKKRNLKITVMTTDINDPNDPNTMRVLQVAAKLGIRRYRMKYLTYDLNRPVVQQLDEWRPRFRDLAAMNRDLGVQAVYQNHASNKLLGATLWDLKHVVEEIPVDEVGVAYDIRHATVEGGTSWPITFNMIRPNIDIVYVKDFRWDGKKVRNVPLGKGQIDAAFFRMLSDTGFRGPISLHEEYLDHMQTELVPQHLAAIRNDLVTLNRWLQR